MSASLKKLAENRKIPMEFFEQHGFSETGNGIEIQLYGTNNEVGRTQIRLYDIKPVDNKKFYWKSAATGEALPIYPAGLSRLPKLEIPELFIVEGTTDVVTLAYCGYNAIGFHGANNVDADTFNSIKSALRSIYIVKENDDAGDEFVVNVLERLELLPNAKKFKVYVLCLPSKFKDVSDFYKSCKNVEEFQQKLNDACAVSAEMKLPVWQNTIIGGSTIKYHQFTGSVFVTYVNDEGKVREDQISNFYFQVVEQKTKRVDDKLIRSVTLKSQFMKKTIEFELDGTVYTDARKLLQSVEHALGAKAITYNKNSGPLLKALGSHLGSTKQKELLLSGGFQEDSNFYLGSTRISADEIVHSVKPFTAATSFKTCKPLGLKKMHRDEAVQVLKAFIVNMAKAYGKVTWPLAIAIPALNISLNVRLDFAAEVRVIVEFICDLGKGKTELVVTTMNFFGNDFNEESFFLPKDSLAVLERAIHLSNGAPLVFNDVKALKNPAEYAERIQNFADGGTYKKTQDGKEVSSQPYKGLVLVNGQQAPSAYSSSYASRAITTSVDGIDESAFRETMALREKLNGVTPWLIQLLLQPEGKNTAKIIYENELALHKQNNAKDMSDLAIDRTIKSVSLATSAFAFTMDFVINSKLLTAEEVTHLTELKNVGVEELRKFVSKQIAHIESADYIIKLFIILIQGMEAGLLFLGREKPEHAASTALCIGRIPNKTTETVWLNYGAILQYLKRNYAGDEIATYTSNAWVRDLTERGFLERTPAGRATKKNSDGEYGWEIKYAGIPHFKSYIE